nr:C. briggsae CBR-DCT-10 protein [Haemonchus contortus]
MQFSLWLRRLEDVMRMKSTAWTNKQKAFFLIGHLDGIAREKIEELSNEEREDYSNVVAHLKQSFEGPQYRYMARQSLASCRQQVGESAAIFANRLLLLVRAAMAGHDPASQKERVLEEFVARLRPDIRYYVKLDNPATFEKAVAKAQMVEQLLAEATADRLIRPSQPTQPIEETSGSVTPENLLCPGLDPVIVSNIAEPTSSFPTKVTPSPQGPGEHVHLILRPRS